MNGYIPLYGGGPQRAAMVSPEAASMPWRSLQQIAEGVDEAGKTWQRYAQNEQLINNFRQQNDFDRWLIDQQAEYKSAVAEDPMNYDQHITLARELKKRAEEWGAGYDWGSEKALLEYEGRRNEWIAKFNASVETETAERRMQDSERSWQANVNSAVERGDFRGAADIYGSGVGIFKTPEEGDAFAQSMSKKQADADFNNLAATNPDLAAEKINRGELDGYFSAAEQEQMMRSLRSHDDSRLTELIEQIASKPKSQSSKQDVVDVMMSGSMYTDEVGFLDVFSKDGNFEACSPQIDSFIYRVADMVQAGEEGATFASKKEDVIRLCKKYGKSSEFKQDVLNRMDKLAKRKEEYPMLKVSERMKEMEGAPLFRQADYNNAIGTLDAEAKSAYQLYADSAKGADMPKDSEGTWTKKYKKERIENLQKNLAAKTEIAVRERFEAWYEGEKQRNGKEPSNVLQEDQLQLILRDVTGRKDLVVPSRGRLLDKNQQHVRKEWVEKDEVRFNTGPKTLTDSEKQALQQKEALRKPVTFPATVSVDTVNTEAPAGILLPESMRKRYGDDVSGLAALVPVSSSSRRGKPLPVVGYTKDSSPQLTLAGASKMRITFSSKMDTNVTISPASAEMREFFKREYLQEGDVPPQDYGLVPDNGVESAEPVSAAFPNGDLTMLPPL